jgi:hypothetical protein
MADSLQFGHFMEFRTILDCEEGPLGVSIARISKNLPVELNFIKQIILNWKTNGMHHTWIRR